MDATQEIKLAPPLADTPPVAKPKREFLGYIHNFRGLIILFVVAAHLSLDWPEDSMTGLMIRILVENDSVMFIFIAGYLFQFLSKKYEYGNYLWKKTQNVIIPYFIISIPILIYRITSKEYGGVITEQYPDFDHYSVALKVALYYLHGSHMIQLWFVPMVVLFYLLAPVFIKIDRNPRWYYLLIPLFIISVLIDRKALYDTPRMFVHYIFPYLFGMFASHYRKEFLDFSEKYWKPVLAAIIITITLNIIYDKPYYEKYNFILKVLFCSFFLFVMRKTEKYMPAGLQSNLAKIAELSFGIYFVHYYFILAVKMGYPKLFGHEVPANFLSWLIYAIVVITGSIVTLRIIKKIFPKKSRLLVGC